MLSRARFLLSSIASTFPAPVKSILRDEPQRTKHLVVVRREETVVGKWVGCVAQFFLFAGLIGLGIALNSDAMQWVGAAIGCLVVISRAAGAYTQDTYDLEGAQKQLDRIKKLETDPTNGRPYAR